MELVPDLTPHGRVTKYVYVPDKKGREIYSYDNITWLYRAGWFDSFVQVLTPFPDGVFDDWALYEIYQDGFARRKK